MITYTSTYPAAARRAVERALAEAEINFIAASADPGAVRGTVIGGVGRTTIDWNPIEDPDAREARAEFARMSAESEAEFIPARAEDRSQRAAVLFVLEVFETIVQVTCTTARDGHWAAEDLRTTTSDFLDQLILHTYTQKHSKRNWLGPVSLDDFGTVVRGELRMTLYWSQLQNTLRELSTEVAETRTDLDPSPPLVSSLQIAEGVGQNVSQAEEASGPLLSVREAAEKLNVSDDTIYRLGAARTIKTVRIGSKTLRVPQAEITRLLATNKYRYR